MSAVQKRIQKLEIRYRTVTWRKRFLEAVAARVLIGILFLTAGLLKREEFSVAISEVTDLYYEARQYPENSGERKKYCATAEKKLQDLSRNYREKNSSAVLSCCWHGMRSFWMKRKKRLCIMKIFFCMMRNIVWLMESMECFFFESVRKKPAKSCGKITKRKKNRIAGGRRKQESETLGGDQWEKMISENRKKRKILWENLSCCFVAADFMQLDDQFHSRLWIWYVGDE